MKLEKKKKVIKREEKKKEEKKSKCDYCGKLFLDTPFGVLSAFIMQRKVVCSNPDCIQKFRKEYGIKS